MTMVELKYSTMEEIITYLMPEDFHTGVWDVEHASQIITDETVTETADMSDSIDILVHGKAYIDLFDMFDMFDFRYKEIINMIELIEFLYIDICWFKTII